MDAHHLGARHGQHAEGIVLAQVVFDGEREMPQILERAQILRVHTGALALGAIGGDVLVGVLEAVPEARKLQRPQLTLARALDRLKLATVLPGHGSSSSH